MSTHTDSMHKRRTTTSPDSYGKNMTDSYGNNMNFSVADLFKGTGVQQPQVRLFQDGEAMDLTDHDTRFQLHAEGCVIMKPRVGRHTRLSPSAEIHIDDGPNGGKIFSMPILQIFEDNWDMSLLQ